MRRIPLSLLIASFGSSLFTADEPGKILSSQDGEIREVCFVLDTTGSMGGLLDGAKRRIWAIVNELTVAELGKPRPKLRIGLVAYRDRGDQYITQITSLSDDLDAVYLQLSALRADGGGDGPESVNQALHDAVKQVQWSPDRNVVKTIFLVGDCPPHMDYSDDIKYPETCMTAVTFGITINALQCGNESQTANIWRDIARRSEGGYAAIPQDGGVHQQETPFDADVATLNAALTATAIGYGNHRQREEVRAKIASQSAAPASASADRADFFAKRRADMPARESAEVISGSGDLLNDVAQKKVDPSKIAKDELPDELQKLSPEELVTEIAQRQQQRNEVSKKLDEKIKQRAVWLREYEAKRPADGKSGFDAQVADMVRTQAAKISARKSETKGGAP